MPVTSLDDSDDDMLFQERDVHIDDLDFPPPATPSVSDRIRQWWQNTRPTQPATYEMVDMDGLAPPPTHPFKKTVNRTFKGTLSLFGAILLVVVMAFVIITPKSGAKTPQFQQQNYQTITNGTHEFGATTILVSLDGFHPHYISQEDTPHLNSLYTNEFLSPFMTPSFPSSTFPNHWTLITGLYPGDHGIVGNTFYDSSRGKEFVNTNPDKGAMDSDFWRGGEPIWETAKRQGFRTAVHMWPGSEVPETGAEVHDKYNGTEVLSKKVDRVMQWIDLPDDERPQLVLAYVPTVDTFGHKYGISGPELKGALADVDNFVGNLLGQLEQRHLRGLVNVVIISDHGMAPTSIDRMIYLEELVDMDLLDHVDGWPLYGLRPKEGVDVEAMKQNITSKFEAMGEQDHYDVYLIDEIPERYHFGADSVYSSRIAPLWIFPKVGYSVTTHERMDRSGGELKPVGVHGYDNDELLMRAIFIAEGPYFTINRFPSKLTPFENVNVYPIVCDSIGIRPAENNGTKVLTRLQSGWLDPVAEYPGLDFEVEHLVVQNNTYDYLYRTAPDKLFGEKTGGIIDDTIDRVKGWAHQIGTWWDDDEGKDTGAEQEGVK